MSTPPNFASTDKVANASTHPVNSFPDASNVGLAAGPVVLADENTFSSQSSTRCYLIIATSVLRAHLKKLNGSTDVKHEACGVRSVNGNYMRR